MRRFRGQKLSKDKDFFTHETNFDYLTSNPKTFSITLGDIPKDELLATAASIQDDTFVKLGLRNHTVKRPTGRRVVSCAPTMEQTAPASPFNMSRTPSPPPPLPKYSSKLVSEIKKRSKPKKERVVSMFASSSPYTDNMKLQETEFKSLLPERHNSGFKSPPPQRINTHKNKLSIEDDFNYEKKHRSTDSLILEIIETYTEFFDDTTDSLPDLVKCLSISSASIDTLSQRSNNMDLHSQFSFEESVDDNEIISKRNVIPKKNASISNKPLPPIPVKKLSQTSYRDYDLQKSKSIRLDSGVPSQKQLQSAPIVKPYTNEYILTRTGGDNFLKPKHSKVRQDENDVEIFTRKCSCSSSRYSSSSSNAEETVTAPTTPTSSLFKYSSNSTPDMVTAPTSPEQFVYKKNPYSPKTYKRNLTPINERNGYEENKTKLCVINND